MSTHRLNTFQTALGWIAILTRPNGIARLMFGYESRDAAVRAIQADDAFSEADNIELVDARDTTLASRITQYAGGHYADFSDVTLDLTAFTEFQRTVLNQCRKIPVGQTMTYGQLAERSGSPRAARAVGSCMAANRVPLIVPCHRVVPAGGKKFGAYSAIGGPKMKQHLIQLERQMCENSS